MCDCEYPDFCTKQLRQARKIHKCCECNREIRKGSKYWYVSGKWDTEIDTFKICQWCESRRELLDADAHKWGECGPGFGMIEEYLDNC